MFCPSVFAFGWGMGKLDIDISQIKKLVELVEKHNLEELTVEEADLSITVKGRAAARPRPVVLHTTESAPVAHALQPEEHHEEADEEEEADESDEELEGDIVDIVSPLVGVFYRTPTGDSPAFVEVGDQIEVGTDIGLIEAMKVFSPIPSEIAGVVVAVPAENGKLVQQGDVLVRVRVPKETTDS